MPSSRFLFFRKSTRMSVHSITGVKSDEAEQALPPYGEPAARQLLTHLPRHGFPYGSPPVKRDVRAKEE